MKLIRVIQKKVKEMWANQVFTTILKQGHINLTHLLQNLKKEKSLKNRWISSLKLMFLILEATQEMDIRVTILIQRILHQKIDPFRTNLEFIQKS
jgi:hypothetical protein